MFNTLDVTNSIQLLISVNQAFEQLATPAEERHKSTIYDDAIFIDVIGRALDKAEAIKARRKEMQFFRDRGVYTKVKRES